MPLNALKEFAVLDETEADQVLARLEHVVAHGALSEAARTQAQTLCTRLSEGVRIVIAGPRGVGKSHLRNVLLEENLPLAPSGTETTILCTGQSRMAASASEVDVVQTHVLDNPLLEFASVLDVVSTEQGPAFAERTRAVLEDADIVLWCTQEFAADEAAVWAQMSDHLKDHSFLVLTKADILAGEGRLQTHIAALQDVAAEEFHSFFPTSCLHAYNALLSNGCVEDTQLAASGVKALRNTLADLAASGRRADLDGALLFLQRNETGASSRPDVEEGPRPDPAPGCAKTYDKALALLRARTADLLPRDEHTALLPEEILSTCGTLAEDLAELAAEQTQSDPAFDLWRNDVYDASDKLVLMSLENDLRSAADAATVVLQLQRGLEACATR